MNPPDWNQIVLETMRRAELIFAEQMHLGVISKSQLRDIVSREVFASMCYSYTILPVDCKLLAQ